MPVETSPPPFTPRFPLEEDQRAFEFDPFQGGNDIDDFLDQLDELLQLGRDTLERLGVDNGPLDELSTAERVSIFEEIGRGTNQVSDEAALGVIESIFDDHDITFGDPSEEILENREDDVIGGDRDEFDPSVFTEDPDEQEAIRAVVSQKGQGTTVGDILAIGLPIGAAVGVVAGVTGRSPADIEEEHGRVTAVPVPADDTGGDDVAEADPQAAEEDPPFFPPPNDISGPVTAADEQQPSQNPPFIPPILLPPGITGGTPTAVTPPPPPPPPVVLDPIHPPPDISGPVRAGDEQQPPPNPPFFPPILFGNDDPIDDPNDPTGGILNLFQGGDTNVTSSPVQNLTQTTTINGENAVANGDLFSTTDDGNLGPPGTEFFNPGEQAPGGIFDDIFGGPDGGGLLDLLFGENGAISNIFAGGDTNVEASPAQTANQTTNVNIAGPTSTPGAGVNFGQLTEGLGNLAGIIAPFLLGDLEGRDPTSEIEQLLQLQTEFGPQFNEQLLANTRAQAGAVTDVGGIGDQFNELQRRSQIARGETANEVLSGQGPQFNQGLRDASPGAFNALDQLLGIGDLDSRNVDRGQILPELESQALAGLDDPRGLNERQLRDVNEATRSAQTARRGSLARSPGAVLEEVIANEQLRDRREDRARGFAGNVESLRQPLAVEDVRNFIRTGSINRDFAANRANLARGFEVDPLLNVVFGASQTPGLASNLLSTAPAGGVFEQFGQGFFNDQFNTGVSANEFNFNSSQQFLDNLFGFAFPGP